MENRELENDRKNRDGCPIPPKWCMCGTFLYNYLLGNHFMNFKGHDTFMAIVVSLREFFPKRLLR